MGHRRSNSNGHTFTQSQSASTNQPTAEPHLQFLLTTSNAPAVNIQPSSPAPPYSPIPHSSTVPSNLSAFDFSQANVQVIF